MTTMKKIKCLAFVLGLLICTTQTYAQRPIPKYLNEIPPGTTPKVFAPGKVSTENEFEFGAVFSNDGNEFYYGVEINGKAETRMLKFAPDNDRDGSWSQPVKILVHEVYSFNDPFLTPDDQKLFFPSLSCRLDEKYILPVFVNEM